MGQLVHVSLFFPKRSEPEGSEALRPPWSVVTCAATATSLWKRSRLISNQLHLLLVEHNLSGKWQSSRKLPFQREIRIEKGVSKEHFCFPEKRKRQRMRMRKKET